MKVTKEAQVVDPQYIGQTLINKESVIPGSHK